MSAHFSVAWPRWYRVSLALICLAGGVIAGVNSSMYIAACSFAAVVLLSTTLLTSEAEKNREAPGGMTEPKPKLTKTSRVIGIVLFGFIAVAAVVFMTKADGNITALLVGGIVLAIAVYAVVMSAAGKKGSSSR